MLQSSAFVRPRRAANLISRWVPTGKRYFQAGGRLGASGVIGLRLSGLTPVERRAVAFMPVGVFLKPGSITGGEFPCRTPGVCEGASGVVSGVPTFRL